MPKVVWKDLVIAESEKTNDKYNRNEPGML